MCRAIEEKKVHAVTQGSSTICSDTVTFLSFYNVVLPFSLLEGEPLISGAALILLSHHM